MDLSMPEMTGKQLVASWLEIKPYLSIVMTTGYDEAELATEIQALNLYKIVRKPVLPAQLKKIINECLANKSPD